LTPVGPPAKARWWAAVRALREWKETEDGALFADLDAVFPGPEGDPTDPEADFGVHQAWLDQDQWIERWLAHQDKWAARRARLDAAYHDAEAGQFEFALWEAQERLED